MSGKALFGNQRKKGRKLIVFWLMKLIVPTFTLHMEVVNEDAKKTLVPPSFEAPADPVSDTELELRYALRARFRTVFLLICAALLAA